MKDTPIRIMQFEFDNEELKRNIPTLSMGLGFSMTLPYLEPYLIRTMREALKHTTDVDVANGMKIFIGQEAQHFRQHRLLNDMLRNCHEAYAGLQEIENEMEADYKHFTAKKSLKFNLAYAEGFEAATCALARNGLKNHELDEKGSDLAKLFAWHLTEEIEHRTVTFDVYKHLYGGYFYRLFVGIYGQYHFFKYVFRFGRFIKANQPEPIENATGQNVGIFEHSIASALSLAGTWLATYLPWYDPSKVKLSKKILALSAYYSEEALEIRGVK